jgi:hypothetical protein
MQEHLTIMRELIQLQVQRSSVELRNLSLPRFNPDTVGADPAAWCSTATLMMKGNPLQGNELFSVLSRALKGSAAHWLTQVLTDEDVTWPVIRELFITRFGGKETAASVLMKASRERPLKNESPGAYGNRLRSLLKTSTSNVFVRRFVRKPRSQTTQAIRLPDEVPPLRTLRT